MKLIQKDANFSLESPVTYDDLSCMFSAIVFWVKPLCSNVNEKHVGGGVIYLLQVVHY